MKHFETEVKWLIGIPVAVVVLALLAMFLPYFL